METPEQRIQRVVREEVAIAPYDPEWPKLFREEKEHLLSCLLVAISAVVHLVRLGVRK